MHTDAEMEDRNRDGKIDHGRAPIYDDNMNIIGEVTVSDRDGNGILETLTRAVDTNDDGVFDEEMTYRYDENGQVGTFWEERDIDGDGIREVSTFNLDTNGDGVIDWKRTRVYDENGSWTGETITESDSDHDGDVDHRHVSAPNPSYFDSDAFNQTTRKRIEDYINAAERQRRSRSH